MLRPARHVGQRRPRSQSSPPLRLADRGPDDPLAPRPPLVEPPAADAPGLDEEGSEVRESSAEACYELARRVARIWEMTPRAKQAGAMHRLLARLEPTGVGFTGMGEHPVEVMRLWRLGMKHARVLGKGSRRILWSMPIALDVPEAVDLLVDVVESEEDELAGLLEEGEVLERVARWHPMLGARLVGVVERGRTWTARRRAMRCAARVDRPAAVEALRRALRAPLVRLRACALEALRRMRPTGLVAEDVRWLLDDALKHPSRGVRGRTSATRGPSTRRRSSRP